MDATTQYPIIGLSKKMAARHSATPTPYFTYSPDAEVPLSVNDSLSSRAIRLEFPDEDIAVLAVLLEDQAPRTCREVWDHLPSDGYAQHAIYSGSEVYARWQSQFVVERENGVTRVIPRDIGYYYQQGGLEYGFPDDLCEICWFYDRDAVPSMPSGPIQVNLFAHMVGDTGPFFEVCRRMRLEGRKRFHVRQAEPLASTGSGRDGRPL